MDNNNYNFVVELAKPAPAEEPYSNLLVTFKRKREGNLEWREVINLTAEPNQFVPIPPPRAAGVKKRRISAKPLESEPTQEPYQSALQTIPRTIEWVVPSPETRSARGIDQMMIKAEKSKDINSFVEIAQTHADDFDLWNLEIFFHRLAALCKSQNVSGAKYASLIKKCQGKLLPLIEGLTNRALANIVWALGQLGVKDDYLMGDLASKAMDAGKATEYDKSISSFGIYQLWSGFSELGLDYHGLNQELSKTIHSRINNLSMPDASLLLFALSRMKSDDVDLIKALCGKIKREYHSCESKHISGNFRAMAILKHYDKELLNKMSSEARNKIHEFTWMEAYHTLWSLACLQHYDADLTDSLCRRLDKQSARTDNKILDCLAWSLSKLRIRDEKLMSRISDAASPKIGNMNWESTVKLAWSFANLNICSKKLIKALHNKVRRSNDITFKYATILGWAFTIFNVRLPINLKRILIDPPERAKTHTVQLRQAYLVALANRLQADKLSGIINSSETERPHSSQTHLRVSCTLKEMGYTVTNEVNFRTAEHIWFDIFAVKGNKQYIVEVDGPGHFAKDGQYIGKTAVKDAIARRLGYDVVHVDGRNWSNRTKSKGIEFLKSLGL